MLKQLTSCLIFLFFCSSAQAYQAELSIDYLLPDSDLEISQDNGEADDYDSDDDGLGVSGYVYFVPVEESDKPLAESAFAAKTSYVEFGVGSLDSELTQTDEVYNEDLETDVYALGARVISDALVFQLSGAVQDRKAKYDGDFGSGESKDETKSYSVGLGTYLSDNTMMLVSLESSERKLKQPSSRTTFKERGVIGYAKHIKGLSNGQFIVVDAELGLYRTKYPLGFIGVDIKGYTAKTEIGFDYYLNRQFSLGGEIGSEFYNGEIKSGGVKIDNKEQSSRFELNAEYFVNSSFSIAAEVSTSRGKDEFKGDAIDNSKEELDSKTYAVTLKGRF